MANKHKHSFLYKDEVIGGYWKLKAFKNPKVKRVLVGCSLCHPKKELKIRKVNRVYSLEF